MSVFDIECHSYLIDLEARLLDLASSREYLYIQQSGGPDAYEDFAKQKWDIDNNWYTMLGSKIIASSIHGNAFSVSDVEGKSRFYTKFSDWSAEIKKYDLCFGTRMHGNMISLPQGIPSIVITHDSRTEELAEVMGIPRITAKEALKCADLIDIMMKCKFDPAFFDENRKNVAKIYIEAIKRIGLEPSEGLLAIAA